MLKINTNPSFSSVSELQEAEGISYLTHRVLLHQYTHKDTQSIQHHIAICIYNQVARLAKRWSASEDDAGNFLTNIYHRIPRLIARYSYYGIQFEHYLTKYINLEYKSFRNREQTKRVREDLIYKNISRHERVFTIREGPSSRHLVSAVTRSMNAPTPGRYSGNILKLVLLTLKFSDWVSDHQLSQVAKWSGVSHVWLRTMCERLQLQTTKRQERYLTLYERRNAIYSQLLHCQYQCNIAHSEGNTWYSKAIFERLSVLRKRLSTTNQKLHRVQQYPSNAEIAALLEIPKGSVDSAMYFMKKKYKKSIRQHYYKI